MFDAKRVLDQLVSRGVAGGRAGGIAGSALVTEIHATVESSRDAAQRGLQA